MNQHLSIMDVIRRAATSDKCCPWCGEFPPLAVRRAGKFLVGCESDDCTVHPQASGDTLSEAWAKWNTRHV
jgi:hypothetical protein